MNKALNKWAVEILFIFFTATLAFLVVLPIINNSIDFPFFTYNVIYAFVGLTVLRYLVLWEWHPMANNRWFKIGIIFIVPLVFFPLMEGIHSFVEFNDQVGIQSILSHLSYEEAQFYRGYIRSEYLFFGIASFLGALCMILKMMRSLWRQYKYGHE